MEWNHVLRTATSRPVPYMHMVEAVNRRYDSPFSRSKGWTEEEIWGLIFDLVKFLHEQPKGDLKMFSCAVNMDDWRTVRTDGIRVPSEVDLCNRYCSERILSEAVHGVIKSSGNSEYISVLKQELLHFVFDRNERFEGPFKKKWNEELNKAESGRYASVWQFVGSVGNARMELTPGIQAADMLAWGLNREATAPYGSYGTGLADALRSLVAGSEKIHVEDSMRREFAPSKGDASI